MPPLNPAMRNLSSQLILSTWQIVLIACLTFTGCYSQCDNQEQGGSLKIITWNIYMLPHLFVHTGQNIRAKEIGETLKNQDADIIVFEEAFDKNARKIIRKELKSTFPYESGNPRKNKFWKTSCGVWIVSKVDIHVLKQIFFKEAMGSDRMACKGALLVKGKKEGFCFQLIGTHLQSDLNSGKEVQQVRNRQYAEIEKELLAPYKMNDVAQLVVGDFNTIHDDSASYGKMVNTLKLTPCELTGDRCYSYDYGHNDLIIGAAEQPQLIDYLFYSGTEKQNLQGNMHIQVFRKKWDNNHSDLSDHFAVAGIISY